MKFHIFRIRFSIYVIEDIKILIVMALNLRIIREEYYHVEISCLVISEQAHACWKCQLLSWECLSNRLSLYEIRVQRMLILPVVHQLDILMGKNFQVPTWLFPTTSLRLLQIVTLSSLTACLCSSTVSRNLGRRMLNQ